MTTHVHELTGCAPAPLANYLKALGILRIVGEQADPQARGWWQGETFYLLTTLDRAALQTFFLERYEPTPLLSPWNKGCGFFKANDPGLQPLEQSTAVRLAPFRAATSEARQLLDQIGQADATIRAIKARTKTTAKGFQTDAQGQILRASTAYQACLDEWQALLTQPNLDADKQVAATTNLATLATLTRPATKPPTRAEAEELKASAAYKRVLAVSEKRFKELKGMLIPDCRSQWRGPHADWLAAAVVLDESGGPTWPSLLGTGGNDGNLDFTNNFMQQLGTLFDLRTPAGSPNSAAGMLLNNALWLEPAKELQSAAVGQYQPGAAGGANSSTGFASGNLVNPWDFVLMMEGTLLFTARATKRFDPQAMSRVSAPFAVRSHAAGFATPGTEKAQRGEQWMPLWKQPATLADVTTLFGEARVQVQRAVANRPLDVLRAVTRLGVARGLDAFVRYGYLERNGQATLAVPLGRVAVSEQQHPNAQLIDDLAAWLDTVQRLARDDHAPARLVHAERRLADSVFAALTHDASPARWQAILHAAVAIEAIQATGTAIKAQPIPPLRPDWVAAVNDGCAEFRLALALGSAASAYLWDRRIVDPVRHHWLPLERGGRRFKTSDQRLAKDSRVVLTGRDLERDLVALVERRLIEARQHGERRLPLVAAHRCAAHPADLTAFLDGALDETKLYSLARAFMALRWDRWAKKHAPPSPANSAWPDLGWLAIRLACLPWPLNGEIDIPAETRIVRLLAAGAATRALNLARQRLTAAGIRPPYQAGTMPTTTARRWAAALAFPIHRTTACQFLAQLDPNHDSQKGPSDA